MKVDAEPKQLIEKHADSRGRITLGTEFADQKVKVLVLDE